MISQEAEELMLSKLKMELGINAVYKMTQMFKDIQLSRDMHTDFVSNVSNKEQGIEMQSVFILTNGNWPIEEKAPCNIPKQLFNLTVEFESYDTLKFNNRKLIWLN